LTRQFVTVVLSGVGGDELFGGYPWRYEPLMALDEKNFETGYYQLWNRLLGDGERFALFTPALKRRIGDFSPFESFRKVLEPVRQNEIMDRALYFEFKTFLNALLMVDDKLSMAHALEARVPFLDNEVVDYARRIPWQYKFQPGQSKRVLREAMKGLLPDPTLQRRKQGFTPPDRTWYSGPLKQYVAETMTGPRALERGYFEPVALQKISEEHFSGRRDHRFLIWSLMEFEWWNRLFVDRERLPQETGRPFLQAASS
jgi:asparagine synthase (glutamine-hydrolysing)